MIFFCRYTFIDSPREPPLLQYQRDKYFGVTTKILPHFLMTPSESKPDLWWLPRFSPLCCFDGHKTTAEQLSSVIEPFGKVLVVVCKQKRCKPSRKQSLALASY